LREDLQGWNTAGGVVLLASLLDASEADNRACPAENAPFYRAQGKAGEVWAVLPDRVAALLGPENSELGLL